MYVLQGMGQDITGNPVILSTECFTRGGKPVTYDYAKRLADKYRTTTGYACWVCDESGYGGIVYTGKKRH